MTEEVTIRGKKAKEFGEKCKAAARAAGVDVNFGECDKGKSDQFEDDGCLHIDDKSGVHAYFDIGQDTPGAEANRATRVIMQALGLKSKISDRVLVEEGGEGDVGDDPCPRCGCRCGGSDY